MPERCDVVIVGTGPAGATIAAELAGTGLHTILLESGDVARRSEVDEQTGIDNVGHPRHVDQWPVRNRILGGSSHTWGGRVAPFDEIDYEQRSWVPGSGWPIDGRAIRPYLERSAAHLGLLAGTGRNDERLWEIAPQARLAVPPDPNLVRTFYWQFSKDPHPRYAYEYRRFGRGLVDSLGPDQTLVLGATACAVVTAARGRRVRGLRWLDPHGRARILKADVVVLCAGGIDNPRILLNSADGPVPAPGNAHDLVGRFLMDHPRGAVADFDLVAARPLQTKLLRFNVHRQLFRAGFRLSPSVQRAEELLNVAVWLGEEIAAGDPWDAMRRIAGGRGGVDAVRDVVTNTSYLARGVPDYFGRKVGVPRKLSALPLLAMCEQRPDRNSRITLGERKDPLGVPLPVVDWRVHPDEARSVRRTTELVASELDRMGFPRPALRPWVGRGEGFPDGEFLDVAHPTGTTRMAADPRDGVVDDRGGVHGVDGLYVAGSSVFPTAGHCNPTQMIVALAIRTADAIRVRPLRPAATVAVRPAVSVAGSTAAGAAVAPAGAAGAVAEAGGPGGGRDGCVPPLVLVTGATGRIGRHVVPALQARGYRVRAVSSGRAESTTTVEWRRLDLQTAQQSEYRAVVDGCAAIVHLAAALGSAETMPAVNADATGKLAAAAEEAGVVAFCYISTVSVYGSPRRRDVDEQSPVVTTERVVPAEYLAMDYVREYARTKLLGEWLLRSAARTVRYTVLRPTVVVDVADIVAIREWSRVKRWLAAHRHAHHVYVADVADAIAWTVGRGLAGGRPAGGVDVFDLHDDAVPRPRHADFLRDAYAATGDRRFRVLPVPGVVDRVHDLIRFRTFSLRKPLWRMNFRSTALRRAGWRAPFGMAWARAEALDRLRGEEPGSDLTGAAAAAPGHASAAVPGSDPGTSGPVTPGPTGTGVRRVPDAAGTATAEAVTSWR